MAIKNALISWINTEELQDVASRMGFDPLNCPIGQRNSATDHLCETCINEHIARGDTVTIIGDSDKLNCNSCGTRHFWHL